MILQVISERGLSSGAALEKSGFVEVKRVGKSNGKLV